MRWNEMMWNARKREGMDRNAAGMKSTEEQPFKAGKTLHKFNKERNTSPKKKAKKEERKTPDNDNENAIINLFWAICSPKKQCLLMGYERAFDTLWHVEVFHVRWEGKTAHFFGKKPPKENCKLLDSRSFPLPGRGHTRKRTKKKHKHFSFFFQDENNSKKNTRK